MKHMTDKEAMEFINGVVATAKQEKCLTELVVYLNYFSTSKRMDALTGGSASVLRTLELITPARRD